MDINPANGTYISQVKGPQRNPSTPSLPCVNTRVMLMDFNSTPMALVTPKVRREAHPHHPLRGQTVRQETSRRGGGVPRRGKGCSSKSAGRNWWEKPPLADAHREARDLFIRQMFRRGLCFGPFLKSAQVLKACSSLGVSGGRQAFLRLVFISHSNSLILVKSLLGLRLVSSIAKGAISRTKTCTTKSNHGGQSSSRDHVQDAQGGGAAAHA